MELTGYARASLLSPFQHSGDRSTPALKAVQKPQIKVSWITVYLIPDILLKILVARDVHANAALAEGFCFDLVAWTRDGGDDNIRDRQTFFKRE